MARKVVGQKPVLSSGNSERGTFSTYLRQTGRWPHEVLGLDPEKNLRALDLYRPLRNVTAAYPPAMLWHGDQDENVPMQESIDMADELERKGVEHELVIVAGAGHGFLLTEAQLANLIEFVSKALEGTKSAVRR